MRSAYVAVPGEGSGRALMGSGPQTIKHGASMAVYGRPSAVMTRSPRPSAGPEMDEQDLVFVVVDDAGEFGAAADEVAGGELAFEDGVLEVVAVTAHGLEDLAEAVVVADVVADEVGLAHLMKV